MCENDICKMKEHLVSAMTAQLDQGVENVNAEEAGQVIDMIKDLAQTEYYCAKTKYYESVTDAMEDSSYRITNFDDIRRNFRMGYTPDHHMESEFENPRYSKAYREWQHARRHYTQTNSANDKEEMDAHAREHVSDTISSMRDIWKSADTDLKKRMKADLSALVAEMTV